MNQDKSIEKLLAQVQLRQPELDVETLLLKAAESEGSVTRREQLNRVRRKRCFCRWATLTGVWTSGLAIGILVMYLYANNSLQTVQDELHSIRAKIAMQDHDPSQPSPQIAKQPIEPSPVTSPETSPVTEPRSLCQACPSPWISGPSQLLNRLIGPDGYGDRPVYAMVHASLAKRNSYYTTYAQPSREEEPESTTEPSRSYKPTPPKTQQQLVRELLEQIS